MSERPPPLALPGWVLALLATFGAAFIGAGGAYVARRPTGMSTVIGVGSACVGVVLLSTVYKQLRRR